LKRRTSRRKLSKSLANFTQWCRENRHRPVRELMEELKAKLQGYYNYYGVSGNFGGLKQFYDEAMKILLKWRNRRSQRRGLNWQGFKQTLDHFKIPRPRIVERRQRRMAVGAA